MQLANARQPWLRLQSNASWHLRPLPASARLLCPVLPSIVGRHLQMLLRPGVRCLLPLLRSGARR